MNWPETLLGRLQVTESGCVEYTGKRKKEGYGLVSRGRRRGWCSAHREMYELMVGPIPEGLEIDHTCNNPPCVNPGHLEPVTHAENMRRRSERLAAQRAAEKEHWDRVFQRDLEQRQAKRIERMFSGLFMEEADDE